MMKAKMQPLGVNAHTTKVRRHALHAFTAFFIAVAFSVVELTAGRELSGLYYLVMPILVLATAVHGVFLLRALRGSLLLEFGETAIYDRSFLRVREVPYSEIEVFSPPLERLFRPSMDERQFKIEAGIEDYLHIQIRFRSAQRGKEKPKDFIFFERIEAPSFEMQERILSHLRNKIVRFELLCDVEIES